MSKLQKTLVHKLIENYTSWLQGNIKLKELDNGVVCIQTPFLDISNDYIEIFIEKKGLGEFSLTDGGYTISNLEMRGCNLKAQKIKKLLTYLLNSFGVKFEGEELQITANTQNFPAKKHNLIQAILAMNTELIVVNLLSEGVVT
jgi:hypothetical protein